MSEREKDLDETRRLLYGCLAAARTKRWELVGTLTNALVHHSGLSDEPSKLLDRLVDLVEYGSPEDHAWAYQTIAELTALADRPAS